MNKQKLAQLLYETYRAAVGGVAHDGNPLPTWVDFRADPAKAKQADAWEAVAVEAIWVFERESGANSKPQCCAA